MKFIIFALLISTSGFTFATAIFPKHESCTVGNNKSSDCDIVLDGDGFLIDGATGGKISAISENTGMMSSSWLYKYGNSYVLEHLDFTSSQSRQWVIFDYANKKAIVDRVYSFSQELSSQSVPLWYGYECRGEGEASVKGEKLSFSESAVTTFCGDAIRDHLKVKKNAHDSLAGITLKLSIPVYTDKKIVGEASYLFFDTDKPDFFQMACYSNCISQTRRGTNTYIGKISKSAWFVSHFNGEACEISGEYSYKLSQQKIALKGCVVNDKIDLIEYLPGTESERAHFLGVLDGEGYRGDWISKSGDGKKFEFLCTR